MEFYYNFKHQLLFLLRKDL